MSVCIFTYMHVCYICAHVCICLTMCAVDVPLAQRSHVGRCCKPYLLQTTAYVHTHMLKYLAYNTHMHHPCIHTYNHISIHMQTCIHTYVQPCIHACIHPHPNAYMHIMIYMHVCTNKYTHTMYTGMCICWHPRINVKMHAPFTCSSTLECAGIFVIMCDLCV